MASQYQHRQFFCRVPNALLARYFESREVDLGPDFGQLNVRNGCQVESAG
jgi:hypothetical protein